MGSLLGILTAAASAAFIISGRLLGFASQPMHSLSLGLALLAVSGLLGKIKLGRAMALDYGQVLFLLLAWAGLWTTAPGPPRFALAHPETALFACLLVSGLLPLLLMREPFAAPGLRRRLPGQTWDTPAFRATARRLSWSWVGLFAACLASTLIPWRFPAFDGAAGRLVFLHALPLTLLLGVGLPIQRRLSSRLGLSPSQ